MKKIFIFIIGILFSSVSLASHWSFQSGLDGEAGLMIIYKALPAIEVVVEQPETIRVPRGNGSFLYSDYQDNSVNSKKREPLKVTIQAKFNEDVVSSNGLNKEIVKAIYNRANLRFHSNGKFDLIRVGDINNKKDNIVGDNYKIDGEVFFSDSHGFPKESEKNITQNLSETIQGGILSQNDIYINARFNQGKKEMMTGRYEGTAVLEVEFLGKEALNP